MIKYSKGGYAIVGQSQLLGPGDYDIVVFTLQEDFSYCGNLKEN